MDTNQTPRSYAVGLPVVVTVNPDGTVTYEVDTSEAAEGVRELDLDQHDSTEAQQEADAALVQAWLDR